MSENIEISVEFFKNLNRYLETHEITKGLRSNSEGLFVAEELQERFVEAYQKYLASTGNLKSLDKVHKKFFGENHALYYFLDGNRGVPGFLLKSILEIPATSRIQIYKTPFLSGAKFLHAKDPWIVKKGFNSITHPRHGLLIELETRFKISTEVLIKSLGFLNGSKKNNEQKENILNLRDALPRIKELLKTAHFYHGKDILPSKYVAENFKLFESKGIIFVVEDEGVIIDAFSIKGREYFKLILEELKTFLKEQNWGTFSTEGVKPPFIGKFWIDRISFPLHTKCFLQFIRFAPKVKDFQGRFKKYITIGEVIRLLSLLFKFSETATPEKILELTGKRPLGSDKYKINGNWLFLLRNKNEVVLVKELRNSNFRPKLGDGSNRNKPNDRDSRNFDKRRPNTRFNDSRNPNNRNSDKRNPENRDRDPKKKRFPPKNKQSEGFPKNRP